MVEQPVLHNDIYPAVDPKNFVGSQKGKVVLVIGTFSYPAILICLGCARGIGQAIAISFAKTGAKLALFDLRNLGETLDLVKKEGSEAKDWELDATNEEQVNKAIDEVEDQLGPIDILVNVAGIVGSRPVLMENYKNFWRTMEVNTGAVSIRLY